MSEQIKIGRLIEGDAERDAIHVAIAPVVADGTLYPGQPIDFITASRERVNVPKSGSGIGVVDPFLTHPVIRNSKFYLFLYPGTITSLRHDWTHKSFGPVRPPESEAWLTEFADNAGVKYQELIDEAKERFQTQRYWIQGGRFEGVYAGDEFWNHFEAVTGQKVSEEQRFGLFSCSC